VEKNSYKWEACGEDAGTYISGSVDDDFDSESMTHSRSLLAASEE
jgi:hypothetical protein